MHHGQILKNTFHICWHNKFLWLLGFLGGMSFSNLIMYNSSQNNFNTIDNLKQIPIRQTAEIAFANVKSAGSVLGETLIPKQISNLNVMPLIFILIVFVILAIYLFITARGAIIWSFAELQGGKKIKLREAWNMGHRFFWRRLSFALFIFAFIIILAAILCLPFILFSIFGYSVLAIIFGLFFGIIFLASLLYLYLVIPISERFLYLANMRTMDAIRSGMSLFDKNWIDYIILYLILISLNIAVIISIFFVLIVLSLPIIGIGALVNSFSTVFSYWYVSFFVILFIVLAFCFTGIKNAFNSGVMTLSYLDIKK